MAYTPNTWQDRTGTGLNKFTDQNGNEYEFTPTPDEITQQGTPFSAAWMNHIEQGIKHNSDNIADIDDKFPVSIANGGTGATTAASAREALQVPLATYPTQSSINDITETGFYNPRGDTTGGFPPGETNYGLLIVNHGPSNSTADTIAQIYISYFNTGLIYVRVGSFGSGTAKWQSWRTVLTSPLPSSLYGTSLPAAGTAGRIFFLKA